ncbi:haloacid dehalogenase type II [Nocardioides caldifontis]|uniref:haloacid dehalogenase type II n=1 Tax=Nocardioides caldifontis TaxID=2588938 RepID=UPI0011E05B18|nr:haloacid dehalogenase type II [Nocardioides caldifontis]
MAHFVLDVNETLSDMAPLGRAISGHGPPAELAHTWFASVLRDGFALSLQSRAPAFLDLAAEELRACLAGASLDAPVDDVVDEVMTVLGDLPVHPDVGPGLRSVVDAGHRVSPFSNGSTAATRGLLERAGLLDLVSPVLSVEDGDVWKPHPDSYAAAAVALQASPEQLTMVAVHPWDLDGAGRAGYRTVWINRHGSAWPDSFRRPDHEVPSLTELVTVA